ncbi:MAG TPA: ATP-binding protein [Bacteroidales bacterium]|nr:ATP-binding protein [Bacteroidales bacterium]
MTLIKKPSELDTPTTIKMLVYGQPGLGKSTLALSAPSPLLLDFDGGVHRVNPMHQTDTVQIRSWQDCLDVLNENLSAYKTLVIDTAGKMLDYMALYLISKNPKLGKSNGALTLQGYGERKSEFVGFLKRISIMGKHIVFVAHDREERNGDDKIIRPEIGGSSAGDLIKELDLVGYMEAIGRKRTISFDPCEKYYGKNSCNLDGVMDVPELKDSRNEFLIRVIEKYNSALESKRQTVIDYQDLMLLVEENLTGVTDATSANQFIDWVGGINHVWDSKLQAAMMLKQKATFIGLKLNTMTKKYEGEAPKPSAKKAPAPEPVAVTSDDPNDLFPDNDGTI